MGLEERIRDLIKQLEAERRLADKRAEQLWGGLDPSNISLDDLGDVNAPAPADGQVLTWDELAAEWQAKIVEGGNGGEANTASNVGSTGTGVFDAKVGVDLQFRKLNPASNKVTIALDAPNKKVDINIDPSKINLDDLGNVNAPAPANDDILAYDLATAKWTPKVETIECFEKYRRSGRYYSGDTGAFSSMATQAVTKDYIYALAFLVPIQQSFDRVGFAIVSNTVGAVGRLGIYYDNGSIYPGNLIVGTEELDISTIGPKIAIIDVTLDPGLYWLSLLVGGANPNAKTFWYYYHMFPILGRDDPSDTVAYNSMYGAEAYGVMPNPFPAGITERATGAIIPAIMVRKV